MASVLVLGLAGPAVASGGAADHGEHHGGVILDAAIAPSKLGDPIIFGVLPSTATWVIDEGRVKLRADGEIEAEIEGLVIPGRNPPNPLPAIIAFLFCGGKPVAETAPALFSPTGNAEIEATFDHMPTTCLTPTVFFGKRAIIYTAVAR